MCWNDFYLVFYLMNFLNCLNKNISNSLKLNIINTHKTANITSNKLGNSNLKSEPNRLNDELNITLIDNKMNTIITVIPEIFEAFSMIKYLKLL